MHGTSDGIRRRSGRGVGEWRLHRRLLPKVRAIRDEGMPFPLPSERVIEQGCPLFSVQICPQSVECSTNVSILRNLAASGKNSALGHISRERSLSSKIDKGTILNNQSTLFRLHRDGGGRNSQSDDGGCGQAHNFIARPISPGGKILVFMVSLWGIASPNG